MRYEVYGRDASLGVYEADSPNEAIEKCVREAGYASEDAMCDALGDDECLLGAREMPRSEAR